MDIKALYEKLSGQQFNLRRAIANTVNHTPHIEQTKNVLYNNFDEIVDALKYATDSEQKMKVLELELSDAERELDEKDAQIKELSGKKTTSKKKANNSYE